MIRDKIKTIIVLGLLGITAWFFYQSYIAKGNEGAKTPPLVFVSASPAKSMTWQRYLTAVGTVAAVNGVDMTPQTSGVVTGIHFKSGQLVNEGDLVLELDPSVLQAEFESAAANLKQKQLTFNRYEKIAKSGAVTDDQVDTARTDMLQATADLKQLRAKLDQLSIRAPFSGKLGLRMVDMGQYLPAGTLITSLQSIDPIEVKFSVASKDISMLKVGQKISFTEDAHPQVIFKGAITAIDSRIDPETRSIDVEANIPNPEGTLVPGLFGTVKVELTQHDNVIVVPETAMNYTLYGDSVFVLTPTKEKDVYSAKQIYIEKGDRQDNLIAIVKGIKAGDMIVTAGQLKLYEGAQVKINNEVEL